MKKKQKTSWGGGIEKRRKKLIMTFFVIRDSENMFEEHIYLFVSIYDDN